MKAVFCVQGGVFTVFVFVVVAGGVELAGVLGEMGGLQFIEGLVCPAGLCCCSNNDGLVCISLLTC